MTGVLENENSLICLHGTKNIVPVFRFIGFRVHCMKERLKVKNLLKYIYINILKVCYAAITKVNSTFKKLFKEAFETCSLLQ